ncbi:MAG: helix-turn-helix transcriptional regulator [Labilithrix sp.]|nr:helix-turn-helix transcriptional regulator [Labilithrix sp.]MCW5815063.1 helix-turn-helix transcriptional regulator [Labilithrix sp.]
MCRDLGQRLIELRRQRGLTQDALAELTGIDTRDLRRIEAGANTTVHTLVGLAVALDVPIIELFRPPTTVTKRAPGRPTKRTAPEPPVMRFTRATRRPEVTGYVVERDVDGRPPKRPKKKPSSQRE